MPTASQKIEVFFLFFDTAACSFQHLGLNISSCILMHILFIDLCTLKMEYEKDAALLTLQNSENTDLKH